MADFRATPLPQVGDRSGTVQDRAVAEAHQTRGYTPQAPDASAMDGLLRGLSQFNSSLGQYTDQTIQTENTEGIAHAKRVAEAQAAVADVSTPEAIQKRIGSDIPSDVPPAFGNVFRQSLGALLVDRHAIAAKTQWADDYTAAKSDPNFNAEQFIAEQRQKALTGLTDPGLAGRMAQHLNELEGAARVSDERDRMKKLDEARETGLYSSLQENLRPDMTPSQQADQFFKYQPLWEQLGFSKKELAQRLFIRQSQLSDQMGGNPAVFDVFNAKDPATGQSLISLNPELAAHVDQARDVAKQKNQKMLLEAGQGPNMLVLDQLDQLAEKGQLTPDHILQNFGPLQAVRDASQGAALLHRSRLAAEKLAGSADLNAAYDAGILGRYKPEDQQKVLEARLGPAVTEAWKRAVGGDGQSMGGLAAMVMAEQNRSKSTVPVEGLTRLISSTLTTTQNPNGPGPEFPAMAALYRGLSADPKFRDMYFKDDTDQLMRSYLRNVDGGSDPVAAYKAAYQTISPEAKQAAEQFTKTPDFAKSLKKVTEAVTGTTFWDKWMPWGATPANGLHVQAAAADEARQYMQSRPYADPKEVQEHLGSWVAQNFVFDKTSGTAVRVPVGSADEAMADALTEYSKRVSEQYRLSDRNDGHWTVQYRPVGDGNLTHVVLVNGSAEQALGTVPMGAIRQAMLAEKSVTDSDRTVLAEVQKQSRLGKFDLNYLTENSAVMAKARNLDLLPKDTLQAIDKQRLDQATQMVSSIPKLALPVPTLENLSVVPQRAVKVDNKLTAQVATQALSAGGELGLAASLTTMGEAVVLRASPDPAKDAGNNLASGYNLKANAATYKDDLRRAGVSPDMIEAVAAGQAQLTPQQALKLTLATLPRYQQRAQDAAEQTAPGLWRRMTPAQRAVMTDVAWQTGDPQKFRKAWSALASGDAKTFADETRVFFTNAKGERVEDKRRGELRAAMLNGDAAWISTIQKYGSFPTTALDAVALNSPK